MNPIIAIILCLLTVGLVYADDKLVDIQFNVGESQ